MNIITSLFMLILYLVINNYGIGMTIDQCNNELLEECSRGEHASLEHIKLLFENKANPNCKNQSDQTPLHYLCMYKKAAFEAIVMLLEAGAHPNHKDKLYGRTPLDLVCRYAYPSDSADCAIKVITLFLESKADPFTQNNWGDTHLHTICKQHDPSLKAISILIFSPMQQKISVPMLLESIYKNNNSFKNIIFTSCLCFKKINVKIPKFIIFEILKFIPIEFLRNFITIKNNDCKTALMLAQEKESNKIITFFHDLEKALNQGWDAFEIFYGLQT